MTPLKEQLGLLDGFDRIDLGEMERVASLQTRFDRKYVLPTSRGIELLHSMHRDLTVLSIDGNCSFRYDTVYFDTPGLDSYLSTARRRRRRFKVRIRTYVDAPLCMLEVKSKGRRGETVKVRTPHPLEAGAVLTAAAARFVGDTLERPAMACRLRPVLTTTFVRTSLVDHRDGSRATLDHEVHLAAPDGKPIALGHHSIFETKSVGVATAADRWLWRRGHRPTSFSKFCVGMALAHPELPANKWNRTLRRDLGWKPARTT